MGLYESLRQKELELQRALDDAAETNERELRRVQKSLQDALGVVEQLLGASTQKGEADRGSLLSATTTAPREAKSVERTNPPPSPDSKMIMRSSQSVIAAGLGDPFVKEFP